MTQDLPQQFPEATHLLPPCGLDRCGWEPASQTRQSRSLGNVDFNTVHCIQSLPFRSCLKSNSTGILVLKKRFFDTLYLLISAFIGPFFFIIIKSKF